MTGVPVFTDRQCDEIAGKLGTRRIRSMLPPQTIVDDAGMFVRVTLVCSDGNSISIDLRDGPFVDMLRTAAAH